MSKNIFEKFTGKYALSKTLRFELRPIGKTLENMREHLRYDERLQTFLHDQEIEDAYQILKPILDAIHEEFITDSLQSDGVKSLNFSDYLEQYRQRKAISDREFETIEKFYMVKFSSFYEETAKIWKEKVGKNAKGKVIFTDKSFKILTEKGILEYIAKYADRFFDIHPKDSIEEALRVFSGFFTYFGGFNQNRENYYETGKVATTAVATRIIHENLPKFCDNLITFETRKTDYEQAHTALLSLGKLLVDKTGKPLHPIVETIFSIQYFSQCLSQEQIERYNDKIGNANFLINLYNQIIIKNGADIKKLPFFKTLFKQIGCGRRDTFFFSLCDERKQDAEKRREGKEKEALSVEEMLTIAADSAKHYFSNASQDASTNYTVPQFLAILRERENYDGIYWSKSALNTISSRYFANWHTLKDHLKEAKVFQKAAKGSDEEVHIPEAIELSTLFAGIDIGADDGWREEGVFFKRSLTEKRENESSEESERRIRRRALVNEARTPSIALLEMIVMDIEGHAQAFIGGVDTIMQITQAYFLASGSDRERQRKSWKESIKIWMEEALAVNQMLKYFLVPPTKAKGNNLDAEISNILNFLLFEASVSAEVIPYDKPMTVDWFKWYDALRNFLTKKPQDDVKENKLKLNFENASLLGGWDVNKESANSCVILIDPQGRKFLAITQKGENKLFQKEWTSGKGKDKKTLKNDLYEEVGLAWKKMEYKLLPGPNKMLPKCLLPKKARKKYGANDKILAIYERGSFKKTSTNFSVGDLHQLIDFYKEAIKKYTDWRCFNFSFRDTSQYQDISQFYSEVEKQGYKIDFVGIDSEVLDQWVDDGKMYLFEIKSQDSNERKLEGHKNNLHTLYWNAAFEKIANCPKLNGEAEIFYRKAISVEKLGTVTGRTGKDGKPVIKNFRFSKEKFAFHVPITLNFCAKNGKINDAVNEVFVQNQDTLFLGIDRGEKHLEYFSLIDKNGKILDQGSLNLPFKDKDGKLRSVTAEKRTIGKDGGEKVEFVPCADYNDLLEARAGDRDYARKNWQTIGTIKDLKNGYVSQVIHEIVKLATNQPTFIALEKLNSGFMRSRQKIEKSIYQKFELALAKKLNFVVDKEAETGTIGSVTQALQLTPPVNNFGDIEKVNQAGIMMYVRADYTSQTDPVTGWRKSVYLKGGSEEYIKEQITGNSKKKVEPKFSDIIFDGKDYAFIYTDSNTNKKWTLYSGKNGVSIDRFSRERGMDHGEWITARQHIPEMLDKLFENFDKSRSLLEQIREGTMLKKINDHTAWDSLRYVINLIQQIRNTGNSERDNDFIFSPVRDENGEHFDSRKYWDIERNGNKASLPSSGDANGAYNIARKGVIMAEHIRRGYSPFIFDQEWDAWLAGNAVWKGWLTANADLVKKKIIKK